jgi:hypothetical protein
MKNPHVLLSILLLASCAMAQSIPEVAPASAGCGPANIKFDVKLNRAEHQLQEPERGKALVYVIEVFQKPPGQLGGTPTIRVGLNGKWVGANRGTSYFSFAVDPGENRVCTNWQSLRRQLSHQHALTSFVAEPGKTYFFKVETRFELSNSGLSTPNEVWSFDLKPISPEEGRNFVSASPLSISRPKA